MNLTHSQGRSTQWHGRSKHKLFAATIGAALIVLLSACGESAESQNNPITVGALIPASGDSAQLGVEAKLGINIAISEINQSGGIDGREIDLVAADSQGDPTVGVNEARRLIEQKNIDALVGPTYSQVTLAVQPQLNKAQIPSINVSGTEELTPDVAPYSFSFLVNASSQAKMMVSYASDKLKANSVAILRDNGDQAKTATKAMKDQLASAGVAITGEQEYEYGASDMTAQILDLRSGDPDALLLFASTGDDTGNFLKSRDQVGWKVPVVGSYGAALAGPAIKIAGKDAYNNVLGIAYKPFSACSPKSVPETTTQFLETVHEAAPKKTVSAAYVAIWYDSIYLLTEAIGETGSTGGAAVNRWIAEHNDNFSNISRGLSASESNKFLIGEDNLSIVYPEQTVVDNVQKRVNCTN